MYMNCSMVKSITIHTKEIMIAEQIKTRNTVSNAHKMIPPAFPCFVWQSPCFDLGNPKNKKF